MCGTVLLGAIFAEPCFVRTIQNAAEMARRERKVAHFRTYSGAVPGKLVYIGVEAYQWVAIKEVV
eukprot:2872850-Ditylum_brightwellii.AAC.1